RRRPRPGLAVGRALPRAAAQSRPAQLGLAGRAIAPRLAALAVGQVGVLLHGEASGRQPPAAGEGEQAREAPRGRPDRRPAQRRRRPARPRPRTGYPAGRSEAPATRTSTRTSKRNFGASLRSDD